MENIWTKLSNELAEVSAAAGKSVVAVHGTRHPSSGIVIGKDTVVAASHAVRRDDEITVVTAPGQKLSARVSGRDPSTDLVYGSCEPGDSKRIDPDLNRPTCPFAVLSVLKCFL
jgi:S1-C subfamily serine protease